MQILVIQLLVVLILSYKKQQKQLLQLLSRIVNIIYNHEEDYPLEILNVAKACKPTTLIKIVSKLLFNGEARGELLPVASSLLKIQKKVRAKQTAILLTSIVLLFTMVIDITIIGSILSFKSAQQLSLAGAIELILFNQGEEGVPSLGDLVKWDFQDDIGGDSISSGNGNTQAGVYPADPQLKMRARTLELFEEASQNGQNGEIPPYYVYGVGTREVGVGCYYVYDNGVGDPFVDLVNSGDICYSTFIGSSRCSYGINHYSGGQVTNSLDLSAKCNGGGTAFSPFQYQVNVVESYLSIANGYNTSKLDSDTIASLPFQRPNAAYLVDTAYITTKSHYDKMYSSNAEDLLSGVQGFSQLNSEQQAFVRWCAGSILYGFGEGNVKNNKSAIQTFLTSCVNWLASGHSVETTPQFNDDTYWDASKMRIKGINGGNTSALNAFADAMQAAGWTDFKQAASGLTQPHFAYTGVRSAVYGYIEWTHLEKLIADAPKESVDTGDGGSSSGGAPQGSGVISPFGEQKQASFNWSSPFGYRSFNGGEVHRGVDLATGGTPGLALYAIADGEIVFVRSDLKSTGGGHMVAYQIQVDGISYIILYMHMERACELPVGTHVTQGQQLGICGNSGGSQGIHLHMEVQSPDPQILNVISGPITQSRGAYGIQNPNYILPAQYLYGGTNAFLQYLQSQNGFYKQFPAQPAVAWNLQSMINGVQILDYNKSS